MTNGEIVRCLSDELLARFLYRAMYSGQSWAEMKEWAQKEEEEPTWLFTLISEYQRANKTEITSEKEYKILQRERDFGLMNTLMTKG